jgi:hypothetical protein
MRLSVDRNDPGYAVWASGPLVRVLLNNHVLSDCITADEELGLAVVMRRDDAGALVTVGGELATDTLRGTVQIERIAKDAQP